MLASGGPRLAQPLTILCLEESISRAGFAGVKAYRMRPGEFLVVDNVQEIHRKLGLYWQEE